MRQKIDPFFKYVGNLGTPILSQLVKASQKTPRSLPFSNFIACVRSERSKKALQERFHRDAGLVSVYTSNQNVEAVSKADLVVLAADPADIDGVLKAPGFRTALGNKPVISVVAGWTRSQLEAALYGSETISANKDDGRGWVIRTLPNIAALVAQSLTVIEDSEPKIPEEYLALTERIFNEVGKTVRLPPHLMESAVAVAGSTPAFFAVICDALIDAAVAVGVPRDVAHTMISQSMLGSATVLANGTSPGSLREQGTSPEGCTIAGVMVLEEGAVRGHVGRALREAVTVARRMGKEEHLNDTRH